MNTGQKNVTGTETGSERFVRAIPFLLCASGGLLLGLLIAHADPRVLVVAACVTAVLVIYFLLAQRFFDDAYGWIFPKKKDEKESPEAIGETREERLAEFVGRYRLTPREAEVLAIIIDNDCALKEVALDLKISERMVQRYMTSIYHKTGTQTRIGLSLQYFGKYREKPHM